MKKNFGLLIVFIVVLSLVIPSIAYASEDQVFFDDFPGVTYDSHKWKLKEGTVTVAGGYCEVGPVATSRFETTLMAWSGALEITFNARPYVEGDNGRLLEIGLYNSMVGIAKENFAAFRFAWGLTGYGGAPPAHVYTMIEQEGGASDNSDEGVADQEHFSNYTIRWEKDRVQFLINGTLVETYTAANLIPNSPMWGVVYYIHDVDSFANMTMDWVRITDDRGLYLTDPTIVRDDIKNPAMASTVMVHTWVPANRTLVFELKTVHADSNCSLWVYRPERLKNYFVQVKRNGTLQTAIKFNRVTKEIRILSQDLAITTRYRYEITFVDPPQWLVDFAFWLIAATGISIMPIVKWWEKTEKINKYLPYILIVIGLVSAIFALWYIWQYLTFIKTAPRLY